MNINVKFTGDDEEEEEEEETFEHNPEEGVEQTPTLSREVTNVRGPRLRYDFWDRNFTDKQEVTWQNFRQKFENDYKEKIIAKYSEGKVKFFVNLIYKDIFCLNKTLKRQT